MLASLSLNTCVKHRCQGNSLAICTQIDSGILLCFNELVLDWAKLQKQQWMVQSRISSYSLKDLTANNCFLPLLSTRVKCLIEWWNQHLHRKMSDNSGKLGLVDLVNTGPRQMVSTLVADVLKHCIQPLLRIHSTAFAFPAYQYRIIPLEPWPLLILQRIL